jgi:hypothetical protein
MHRDPAARRVHRGDDGLEHGRRDRLVIRHPVADELGPASAGRLRGGDRRQLRMADPPSPSVEELPGLGDPPPGVHAARHVTVAAEPVRRVTGEARRPDHGDASRHVFVQVVPQQRLVQRLAARFGTRVSVRVD